VAAAPPLADALAMFESGIGPGARSERFGTWSLITFLLLFVAPLPGGRTLVWVPLLACAGATLAAVGCGLAGVFIREQRRPALHGLLKATVPLVVGGTFGLFLLALSSMNFE
jgi:uncharacterized iron-regulated membrane protein